MLKTETNYGIIFITGKMYAFYKIIKSGDHIEHKKICSNNVDLPNKHNKGGQSSLRFSKLHAEKVTAYIKKVSELVPKYYMTNNNTECLIDKLFIAGSGKKKKLLAETELVKQYFSNKINLINTSDVNDQTIYETINNCNILFHNNESEKETRIIEKIKNLMINNVDQLVFGIIEINNALLNCELQEIIITEEHKHNIDLELVSNSKIKLHIVSFNIIKDIGIDCIGVKFF